MIVHKAWSVFRGQRQHTWIDRHNQQHVRCCAYLICDGRRGCIRGNRYSCFHFLLMNRVDEGNGIRLFRGQCKYTSSNKYQLKLTRRFDVKAVQGATGSCDIIDPLEKGP